MYHHVSYCFFGICGSVCLISCIIMYSQFLKVMQDCIYFLLYRYVSCVLVSLCILYFIQGCSSVLVSLCILGFFGFWSGLCILMYLCVFCVLMGSRSVFSSSCIIVYPVFPWLLGYSFYPYVSLCILVYSVFLWVLEVSLQHHCVSCFPPSRRASPASATGFWWWVRACRTP